MRIPAADPDLAANGHSYLDQLAGLCGGDTPDWIKTDVGRARAVLAACEHGILDRIHGARSAAKKPKEPEHGHDLHHPRVTLGCPQRCQDAVDLLEAIRAVNGLGQNFLAVLPESERPPVWLVVEIAYLAGRLGSRLEARPREPVTDKGQRSADGSDKGKAERKKRAAKERSATDAKIRRRVRELQRDRKDLYRGDLVLTSADDCDVTPQRVRDTAGKLLKLTPCKKRGPKTQHKVTE